MNRIQIMRPDPKVINMATEQTVIGRSGDLLRLLIMNEGRLVRNESIADLHSTELNSVSSKVRDLRRQLGSDHGLLITSEGNAYKMDLNGWHVDAFEFREAVKNLDALLQDTTNQLPRPAEALEAVENANIALRLWNGNPAINIRGVGYAEVEFDTLKLKAENYRLKAQLLTGMSEHIKEAIQELFYRSRTNPDEAVWLDLLLAHDALESPVQVMNIVDRIRTHYGKRIPSILSSALTAISENQPLSNPYRRVTSEISLTFPRNPDRTDVESESLPLLCNLLGITTASQLRLDGQLKPLSCIRRTRRRLYFSGVLASKWVLEPAVRSEFDRLLTRLDQDGGDVRFLIIDPYSKGFSRLNELRQGAISLESVNPLLKLASVHPSLQVRGYSNLPAFRIVIIDDDVVSFSPYRLAAENYILTDRGYEAPHIVLDPLAQFPLAEAFHLLFMETWDNSTPLEVVK